VVRKLSYKKANSVSMLGLSSTMAKSVRAVIRICASPPKTDVDCSERACGKGARCAKRTGDRKNENNCKLLLAIRRRPHPRISCRSRSAPRETHRPQQPHGLQVPPRSTNKIALGHTVRLDDPLQFIRYLLGYALLYREPARIFADDAREFR
jgi:hypothetical protein